MKIKDINFLVVDVETTGSKKNIDRVIDIACVVVQNGLIVDQYESLLDPERHISKLITKITSITNEMVMYAPTAKEIMPTIENYMKLPDAVFVGHFVSFDYGFVNLELRRAGLSELNLPMLDTLKLAQKILPEDTKKNVGAMSKYYGVQPLNRHRALGDAKATAYSLIEMLKELNTKYLIDDVDELMRFQDSRTYQIKSRLKKIETVKAQLQQLPETPGIFYFIDAEGKVIYIGTATNLKTGVNQFFNKSRVMSQKIPQLVSRTDQIKWQETNTDISAALLQIAELHKHKPEFNSQHFNEKTYSFIKITQDKYPAVFRCSHIKKDNADYIGPFSNRFLIDNIMLNVRQNFRVRNCRGKLNDTDSCIYHDMACCFSPCTNEVSEIVYHEEIGKLKQYILKGYEAELINEINRLSDKMEFESAAFLRNQLFDLKNVKLNPTRDEIHLFNSHYIAILPYGKNSGMCMLFVKSGLLMHDMIISEDTDQTTIYDAIVSTFTELSIKTNYSTQEIQQCLMMQSFLSRGNGDVNIIEVTNDSTDLDIFEECGTFLDNFFIK